MEIDSGTQILNLCDELTKHAYNQSIEAHKHNQPYFTNTAKIHDVGSSSLVEVQIFAFKGSWEVNDWYHDDHFGQTDVDQILFPSLKRIGENRLAKVNKAILQGSQNILNNPVFKSEVQRAVKEKKKNLVCRTLICDGTLSHAVRRENWTGHFTHFVMEHDIVPRIMLAPNTSIQKHLPKILQDFQKKINPTTKRPNKLARVFSKKTPEQTTDNDQLVKLDEAAAFFESVLINASTVASHDAFDLMEPTSTLKEKLSVDFVKVSPYRPFGGYVFCTRDESQAPDAPRQQLVVDNPNAVLQLLFYFLQLPNENQDLAEFAVSSLAKSLGYEEELNNGMQLQNRVCLKDLYEKLWTSNGTTDDVVRTSSKALFELTPSAKWCLMAAEEAEKRKKANEKLIRESMRAHQTEGNKPNQKIIEDILDIICNYKITHDNGNEDYYEAFKLQDKEDDFVANVNRLELAKIYDVIIEMVMRHDLPDEFEACNELIVLGTKFRRLIEPLDIANYYRHLKGDGYMDVRPKRYKFTQRWYEHARVMGFESISESNFVAEVEELKKEVETPKNKTREQVKKGVEDIKNLVEKWKSDDKIENDDVFWGYSILSKLQEKLA
ncbi:EDS1-like protein [Tanacetum coccineum]